MKNLPDDFKVVEELSILNEDFSILTAKINKEQLKNKHSTNDLYFFKIHIKIIKFF